MLGLDCLCGLGAIGYLGFRFGFVVVQIFTFGVCLCCCVAAWFGGVGVDCGWFCRFLAGVLVCLCWVVVVVCWWILFWLRKLLSLCVVGCIWVLAVVGNFGGWFLVCRCLVCSLGFIGLVIWFV